MAEGRMLSKRITRSFKVAGLSSDTVRMFYSWLIPYLDVEGRMEADKDMLKADIVPLLKHITTKKIVFMLKELHEAGLIVLYKVNGCQYLELVRFSDHQRNLRKDKERPSAIPAKTEEGRNEDGPTPEKGRKKAGKKPEEGRHNIREEKLREEKQKANPELERNQDGTFELKEKPKDLSFSQTFADRIITIREKFKSPSIEAAVVLFVTAHSKNAPQEEMIYCLDQFIKYGHGIDTLKIKIYLEKILLKRVQNRNEAEYLEEHKDDKGTPEGDKAAMENLGNILKTMKIPLPEKEICLKCNNSYSPSLIENGTCVFCNPGIVTTQCPQCTRTVGKNLLDKTTGLCRHCMAETA